MPQDHPITHAKFAVQEQLTRLSAWKAKDDRSGGHQAAKIDARAAELEAILSVIDYALKLERIVMHLDAKVERAKEANWMAGYTHRILEAADAEMYFIQKAINLSDQKNCLIKVLDKAGIHVHLPEGDKLVA